MPRLLVGNFDCEWCLTHPGRSPPAALQRLSAELATAWLAVAEPDDVLWMPLTADADFWPRLQAQCPWHLPRRVTHLSDAPRGLHFTPWGWSSPLEQSCRAAGIELPQHPAAAVVHKVNSRRFSTGLEAELAVGLTGARWLTRADDLCDLLQHIGSRSTDSTGAADQSPDWVLKADLSHSARERIIGRGAELSPRDRSWVEARLQRDGGVVCEPWVDIVAEAGLQWEVPIAGDPQLVGVTPLLTDARGHYRGSAFADSGAERDWSEALPFALIAARRIQAEGYFGPLGIDCCRYRDAGGGLRLRPLMDINARWTMGRLSLGWRRWLRPEERGVWRHGPPGATLRQPWGGSRLPQRILVTSPQSLNGIPTRISHRVECYDQR